MTNQFTKIGAGVSNLSPTDFFVQVNDTIVDGDEVTIFLPKTTLILEGNTTIFPYTGIRFSSIATTGKFQVNIFAQDGERIMGEQTISFEGGTLNDYGLVVNIVGEGMWLVWSK
jgi:hypothetical protein